MKSVDVIGRDAFIENKKATGRARDLADVEALGGSRARGAPVCAHSASGGQPNDDENRIVLLAAAVHGGHGSAWSHRPTRGPHAGG